MNFAQRFQSVIGGNGPPARLKKFKRSDGLDIRHNMNVRTVPALIYLILLVTAVLALAACGESSASPDHPYSGCEQVVHDVPGRVLPETSGLSCSAIKEMIAAGPADPGVITLEVAPNNLPWKCRLYGPSSRDYYSAAFTRSATSVLCAPSWKYRASSVYRG